MDIWCEKIIRYRAESPQELFEFQGEMGVLITAPRVADHPVISWEWQKPGIFNDHVLSYVAYFTKINQFTHLRLDYVPFSCSTYYLKDLLS